MIRTYIATFFGKLTYFVTQKLSLGAGGTWPGEIALKIAPHFIKTINYKFKDKIIVIAGTNGKTTTSLMISQILSEKGFKVLHNTSGANLLNGTVSAYLQNTNWLGQTAADYAVLEVDENALSQLLEYITPKVLVILNLFRDQLDRYGEVDVIAERWLTALKRLPKSTTLILNSDDPQVSFIGKNIKTQVKHFGIEDNKLFLQQKEHAVDSTFCLNCGFRLTYDGIYFSHLGIWRCTKCKTKRTTPDLSDWLSVLPGLYNKYNTLAAVSGAQVLGIDDNIINAALEKFSPAFGRQEEFETDNKKVKIFLSKNPAGFNASLRTVLEFKPSVLLLILNDRIPDGRDVSWIWDVDFETIPKAVKVIVSGDRVFDLGLRMKYAEIKNLDIVPNLDNAIRIGLGNITHKDTLFILPTYSAMLEVRKNLLGKKIL